MFDYSLLRDVADQPEAALQASLERLSEADIVVAKGDSPDSAYRFKHALIRDAAYESLLRSRRRALHLRAPELLRDPTRAIQEPDAIARHIAAAERRGRNWRKTPRIGRARALPADGTDCLWLKSYKFN